MLDFTGGDYKLPVAGAGDVTASKLLFFLPVTEITNQVNVQGIRCPFPEDPATSLLVQAIVEMSRGKVAQAAFAILCELIDFPNRMLMTSPNSVLIWSQPFIMRD